MSMDAAVLFDRLLTADVLQRSSTEQEIELTDTFRSAVEDERRMLENSDEIQNRVSETLDEEQRKQALTAIAADDPEFVASYLVLAERVETLSWSAIIRALVVLGQLDTPNLRDEGAPDSFLPMEGERLTTLLRLGQPSIVYVWREDCPPCATMKQELTEILENYQGEIALFAVYGPDSAELLYEEYDVVGAPTLLFVHNNRIISRLQGDQYREAIEPEIALLQERSGTD